MMYKEDIEEGKGFHLHVGARGLVTETDKGTKEEGEGTKEEGEGTRSTRRERDRVEI